MEDTCLHKWGPRLVDFRILLRMLALVLALLALALEASGDIITQTWVVGLADFDPMCTGKRSSVVVNGKFPGPTLYVQDGDDIIINVVNNQSLPITLHWHGLTQHGTQWYDGVPGVTQCALKQGKTYTHKLRIRGQVGTFWWHSHVAQLRNTLHGAIIIRPTSWNQEPLNVPIAKDMLLLGGDWFKQSPQQLMDTIGAAPFPGYPIPESLHINGKTLCDPEYFRVAAKKWYRLRVISTGMWSSYNLQLQKHMLVLFETEGGYLAQQTVKWLDVYPGQSYSVLFYTNQKPGNYWVVLTPRYDVAATATAYAVLTYSGVKAQPPTNTPPTGPNSTAEVAAVGPDFQAQLRSANVIQDLATAKVTKLIVLEVNLHTLASQQQFYSINNVSMTGPSVPFLLADYKGISKKVYSTKLQPFLPPSGLATAKGGPFKAKPAVLQVPYGAWVQIVFQNHNPPGGLHPWHTHGYNFYVVAQGNGTFDSKRWKKYKYNLVNPPYRNTVALFDSSWVAVRFQATNPGQWIVHCHYEQHADMGLGVFLKVLFPKAKKGLYNGPAPLSAPPSDYPAC